MWVLSTWICNVDTDKTSNQRRSASVASDSRMITVDTGINNYWLIISATSSYSFERAAKTSVLLSKKEVRSEKHEVGKTTTKSCEATYRD